MDYFAWLQFIQALATAYATSQGKDTRALGYLRVASNLVTGQQTTNTELLKLQEEYAAKVLSQLPTTAEELTELDARIEARSEAIQSA